MFSERLKAILESQEISQASLAKELGFTSAAINRWCQNITQPDYETLAKIASYLNVSIDYLLGTEKTAKEFEEKQALKKALISAGYMKEGEDLTKDELERLMKFVKNNKDFIKGK